MPKKGRLWLYDGSCIRLRPEYENHIWSYDFVQDQERYHHYMWGIPSLPAFIVLFVFSAAILARIRIKRG